MSIEEIRLLVEPFITIFTALLASGAGASVAVQLLKLNWFPLAVSKYPRITSVIVSLVSSLVAIYVSGINFIFTTPLDYVGFGIGTLIMSAVTYKLILKGTTSKDGKSVETIKSA